MANRITVSRALCVWLSLLVWLWLPLSAAGQNLPAATEAAPAVELPKDLTRDQVRELISRLSDEEARQLLIRQLDRVAAQGSDAAEQSARSFDEALHEARERLKMLVLALPRLPSVGAMIFERLSEGRTTGTVLLVFLFKVLIFTAGAGVEWLFRRMFAQFGEGQGLTDSQGVVDKLGILFMRLIRDLLALAVFALTVTGLFFIFYEGHETTRLLFTTVVGAVVVMRLVALVGRFLLAPHTPSLRLPPIEDATARRQYGRLLTIAGVIVGGLAFAHFTFDLIMQRPDPDTGLILALGFVIAAVALGAIIVILWMDRETVGQLILSGTHEDGQPPGRVRLILAANWHVFATCFIVALYLVAIVRRLLTGESQGTLIVVSLLVLLVAPILDWMIGAAMSALFRVNQRAEDIATAEAAEAGGEPADEAAAEMALHAAERKVAARKAFRDVLVRNLRIILVVVIVVFLTRIWNIDLTGAVGVGEAVAGALFDIVITLILASAVWGALKVAIQYAVPDGGEHGAAGEGEAGGTGGSRLQTLVPLLGRFLLITLAVIVTLIVLSELGVDIGPLIAGAGVIGIAIGFGAQTLVKDIISGVFFLADDAFRVGEYIDVGDVMGTVEHISIRSLRLRHHRGPVHTVPFGEIRHLTNFSRDWAIMKIEFRLPFDADLEKVRRIIKKVGQTLMDDPVYGPNFLQPVKSQGVHRMDDSAFIIRVKFMAKPGEQFTLRREVFRMIQEAFAEAGIHFAPRRVIVETEGGHEEHEDQAAAAAADQMEPQQG